MADNNGAPTHDQVNTIIAGSNLGLGVSASEGKAVVLLWIDNDHGEHLGMALSPMSARQLASALESMATQADEIDQFVTVATTPDELTELLDNAVREMAQEQETLAQEQGTSIQSDDPEK